MTQISKLSCWIPWGGQCFFSFRHLHTRCD